MTNTNIVQIEKNILNYFDSNDTFQQTQRSRDGKQIFSFYDGPPFATGLPHYGHMLAGTIKDVICRYQHSRNHYVERKFGWDCHGLPVEYEIDKTHNITNKEQVENMTIATYNSLCKSIVLKYTHEWEHTVKAAGRWVSFEQNYKTMDLNYMESVWWVFSQLYEKNLIYKGFKVMPYSIGCRTALSNFEAGENYKLVSDPAITVIFQGTFENLLVNYLVYTTTPWTLVANAALCVNANANYSLILFDSKYYIIASALISTCFTANFTILQEFSGVKLINLSYTTVFNYNHINTEFIILADDYVKESTGTGIVHIAPAFGEDDYRVFNASTVNNKNLFTPINDNCCFTSEIPEFAGQMVKDAEKNIIRTLKQQNLIFKHSEVSHQYPFCWRSQSRIIYRAMPNWFVDVPKLAPRMCELNAEIRWVPESVGKKRFHNWIQNSHPWAISRSRYWGTPIPIWTDVENTEILVIRDITHLKSFLTSDVEITNLHREFIDDLIIISPTSGKPLKRIPEVFDCWFESGSMPYASVHYPFEGPAANEKFLKSFPADFIAEGLDQTRGWFYTLLIISTALFDKPAFKNVIVNGIVLAENGEKMSKSLKNYPPVDDILTKYGADALRLYLIGSPAVYGEPLAFKESGVSDVIKNYHIYLLNLTSLVRETPITNKNYIENDFPTNNKDKLTIWILSEFSLLIKRINESMLNYKLSNIYTYLTDFIKKLSSEYLNYSKNLTNNYKSVVKYILIHFAVLTAPFTPLLSEYMYQTLVFADKSLTASADSQSELQASAESVHFAQALNPDDFPYDEKTSDEINTLCEIILLGRKIRETSRVKSIKFPLESITIFGHLQPIENINLIKHILNINEIKFANINQVAKYYATPNNKVIGPRAGKQRNTILKEISELTDVEINKLLNDESIELPCKFILLPTDVSFEYALIHKESKILLSSVNLAIECNDELTVDSINKGILRELISNIQLNRKNNGIIPTDNITIYIFSTDVNMLTLINDNFNLLENTLKKKVIVNSSDNILYSKITISTSPYDNDTRVSVSIYCQK